MSGCPQLRTVVVDTSALVTLAVPRSDAAYATDSVPYPLQYLLTPWKVFVPPEMVRAGLGERDIPESQLGVGCRIHPAPKGADILLALYNISSEMWLGGGHPSSAYKHNQRITLGVQMEQRTASPPATVNGRFTTRGENLFFKSVLNVRPMVTRARPTQSRTASESLRPLTRTTEGLLLGTSPGGRPGRPRSALRRRDRTQCRSPPESRRCVVGRPVRL